MLGGGSGQQTAHTYPAHGPPSHPAEWSEGTEGQEVVENRQGPGAQFQGRSGHAAQLSQPPPQSQLGEVQPAGHMSPMARVSGQDLGGTGSPHPTLSKPFNGVWQHWPCPPPPSQPHFESGLGRLWSEDSLPGLSHLPASWGGQGM